MPDIYKKHGKIIIDGQCRKCGEAPLEIGEGKGPHIARYDCKKCGTFAGWVSRVDMFILKALETENPLKLVKDEWERTCRDGPNPAIPSVIASRIAWERECDHLAMYVDRLSAEIRLDVAL